MTRRPVAESLRGMQVISSSSAVRAFVAARCAPGQAECSLVPTMGALHAGHTALIRQGAQIARERGLRAGCVVTIFVNPTQFNEKDDYTRYPRTLEADLEKCRAAGAAVVLAPEAEDVYPPGAPPPMPALPREAVEPGLEDAARPGHFGGVCQVVARLFDMVRPGVAVFGEKDWQQLRVVAAMVRRERWPIEVVGAPTVREADGLAMSSRNIFLSADDRVRAQALSRGIALAGRESTELGAEATLRGVLADQGITPDYAVVRNAETLMPMRYGDGIGRPRRALVAARVGPVRLLDNGAWPIQDPNMKIGS